MNEHEEAPVLSVRGLSVEVLTHLGWKLAVTDVSFSVKRGETVAIVGETGSGKSLTGMAIMGLLAKSTRRSAGVVEVAGRTLAGPGSSELTHDRQRGLAMVFQNPMTSLNPSMQVGAQVAEAVKRHTTNVTQKEAWRKAVDLLGTVDLRNPEGAARHYPHEFSGGMRQRAMIAIAIACNPLVLIADEPTTALDATVQQGVMMLLDRLRLELGLSIVLISHNLALISGYSQRINVMYAGELVETGSTASVLRRPRHPYVDALIGCTPDHALKSGVLRPLEGRVPGPGESPTTSCRFAPRCRFVEVKCCEKHPSLDVVGTGAVRCVRADEIQLSAGTVSIPQDGQKVSSPTSSATCDLSLSPVPRRSAAENDVLVSLSGVSKSFAFPKSSGRPPTRALVNIDLELYAGESLGVVGESGSGKSTLGNIVSGLLRTDTGEASVCGQALHVRRPNLQALWESVQIVFQDPYSSLNPAMSIGEIVSEPLRLRSGRGRSDALMESRRLLERVGLDPRTADSMPGSLSGGQRQRVSIARAIAIEPKLIICDEAVSALDVSVQAQVLLLLRTLQEETGVSYLFITHDIGVVRLLCDRVAVMSSGHIIETCEARNLEQDRVSNEITKELLAAVPRITLDGHDGGEGLRGTIAMGATTGAQ